MTRLNLRFTILILIQENFKKKLSYISKIQSEKSIKGVAEKISESDSIKYFNSRPVGSQLGAIVSNQSEIIPNRKFLEDKLSILEKQYENQTIPKPDFWGGFIVKPISMEFWQGRPNRLHDRIRFQLNYENTWKTDRLSP